MFIFPDDRQRTRLTHALEVAHVAAAVARAIGRQPAAPKQRPEGLSAEMYQAVLATREGSARLLRIAEPAPPGPVSGSARCLGRVGRRIEGGRIPGFNDAPRGYAPPVHRRDRFRSRWTSTPGRGLRGKVDVGTWPEVPSSCYPVLSSSDTAIILTFIVRQPCLSQTTTLGTAPSET